MFYYVLIDNSESIDESEGLDVVGTTELNSKRCITCRFYYYCSKNFRYGKNVCDGCYHCIMYKNENPSMIFRILTLKEEKENNEITTKTYRTVSSYFFSEIENLLNKGDINGRKFGWLYKENFLSENDIKNETKNEVEMN